MNNKVYITISNEFHSRIAGVYRSERLAKKTVSNSNGELMDLVKGHPVIGYPDVFDNDMCDSCKYYIPKLNMIRILISTVYDLEGCICGGLGHIIVDDNNYDDGSIDCILKLCNEEENKERVERGLVELICKELKQISIQQRALIFTPYYMTYSCDGNCDKCPINEGKTIE